MRDISQEWKRLNTAIEKYEQEGIDEMELAMYEMQVLEGLEEAIFKAVNDPELRRNQRRKNWFRS